MNPPHSLPAYQATSLGIGMAVAIVIFVLIRRNHLMVSHSIWWLLVAAASMIFGAWPRLIDMVGAVLGIQYPPILLVIIGMGMIIIKMLTMDLNRSLQERKIRALTQRLAIIESCMEIHHLAPSPQDTLLNRPSEDTGSNKQVSNAFPKDDNV